VIVVLVLLSTKKDRAEFGKNARLFTSSTKEVMTISKARPLWISGGPNLEEKEAGPSKI